MKSSLHLCCSSPQKSHTSRVVIFAWFQVYMKSCGVAKAFPLPCTQIISMSLPSLNGNSPPLWVIWNSTRLLTPGGKSCPLLTYYYLVISGYLHRCLVLRHVYTFLWSRDASLRAILFFRQQKFLDCYLITFTHSQFHIGINNLYEHIHNVNIF